MGSSNKLRALLMLLLVGGFFAAPATAQQGEKVVLGIEEGVFADRVSMALEDEGITVLGRGVLQRRLKAHGHQALDLDALFSRRDVAHAMARDLYLKGRVRAIIVGSVKTRVKANNNDMGTHTARCTLRLVAIDGATGDELARVSETDKETRSDPQRAQRDAIKRTSYRLLKEFMPKLTKGLATVPKLALTIRVNGLPAADEPLQGQQFLSTLRVLERLAVSGVAYDPDSEQLVVEGSCQGRPLVIENAVRLAIGRGAIPSSFSLRGLNETTLTLDYTSPYREHLVRISGLDSEAFDRDGRVIIDAIETVAGVNGVEQSYDSAAERLDLKVRFMGRPSELDDRFFRRARGAEVLERLELERINTMGLEYKLRPKTIKVGLKIDRMTPKRWEALQTPLVETVRSTTGVSEVAAPELDAGANVATISFTYEGQAFELDRSLYASLRSKEGFDGLAVASDGNNQLAYRLPEPPPPPNRIAVAIRNLETDAAAKAEELLTPALEASKGVVSVDSAYDAGASVLTVTVTTQGSVADVSRVVRQAAEGRPVLAGLVPEPAGEMALSYFVPTQEPEPAAFQVRVLDLSADAEATDGAALVKLLEAQDGVEEVTPEYDQDLRQLRAAVSVDADKAASWPLKTQLALSKADFGKFFELRTEVGNALVFRYRPVASKPEPAVDPASEKPGEDPEGPETEEDEPNRTVVKLESKDSNVNSAKAKEIGAILKGVVGDAAVKEQVDEEDGTVRFVVDYLGSRSDLYGKLFEALHKKEELDDVRTEGVDGQTLELTSDPMPEEVVPEEEPIDPELALTEAEKAEEEEVFVDASFEEVLALAKAEQAASPALVTVRVRLAGAASETVPGRLGTGFLVSRRGFVLTTSSLLIGEAEGQEVLPEQLAIEVETSDGRTFEAFLVDKLEDGDACLLKIPGSDLPSVTLGGVDGLAPGNSVLVVGSPDDPNANSTGQVANVEGGRLETDAKIYFGNSGGPVLRPDGRVVGLAVGGSIRPETADDLAEPVSLISGNAPSSILTIEQLEPLLAHIK